MLAALLSLVDSEVNLGMELGYQPIFQLLAFHLMYVRAKGGADEIVGRVVDSPDEIGVGLAKQGGGIRESRQVLPDFLGVTVVLLELDPFGLVRKGGKFLDQRGETFSAEAHLMASAGTSPQTSIWPVTAAETGDAVSSQSREIIGQNPINVKLISQKLRRSGVWSPSFFLAIEILLESR